MIVPDAVLFIVVLSFVWWGDEEGYGRHWHHRVTARLVVVAVVYRGRVYRPRRDEVAVDPLACDVVLPVIRTCRKS